MLDINGKRALVTGGSRGIGAATSLLLSKFGCEVVIVYRHETSKAEEVGEQIRKHGKKSWVFKCDVSDYKQSADLKKIISEEVGKIDILVNNAGRIIRPSGMGEMTESEVEITVATNLTAAIFMIELFSSDMVSQGWGRIVNVGSIYGEIGATAVLAYCSAKAGINTMTRAVGRELGKKGVLVNCVAPGNIETDMTSSAGPEFMEWVRRTTPVGRLGTPEEVAEGIIFLIRSTFINGHILVIDGGYSLNV